jgi:outer membrane receptor protein involved in Fe transport
MAKLSWMVNVAHDLQLSIYGDSARNGEGPNRTMLAPGEAAWTRPTAVAWMGTARYTWILDPSLVLCAALSIGRDRRGEGLSEPGTAALFDHAGFYRDVVRPADPTAAPGNYGRLWQGGAGYAADSRGGHLEMDLRFNWTLNTHGLTFGYNFRRDNLQWNRGFSGADIAIPALGDFAGGISHGAFVHLGWRVDPDTGAAMDLNGDGRVDEADALYIQTGGMLSSPEARGRSDAHGLFVQDTWRVTPNWTLSLGIRNDLQCLSGDRGSVRFLSNWAPRLGVIWDPFGDGKTGIRAAWGRYYGRVPAELGIRAFSGEGFVSDVLWADPALTDCRNAELGEPVRVFGGHPAMVADGTGAECQDEILAGVQREITPGLAVSATFIRRDLRRALARIGGLSVEDYLADESPAVYAFLLANPSPSLDAVHNDSGAPGPDGRPDGWPDVQRSFTALELSLDRRFSGGVQFRASYRLGWLTGNYDGPAGDAGFADGPAAGGRFNFLPGPALGYLFNDGPLALDQRHVVTASGVWELPHHFRVGWGFQAASGAPVMPLGTHPVYQVDGVIPLASRGAAGRLEWECTAALHAEYRLPLGDGNCRLALGADLFNVLNRQSAASADTRSQSFFSPNPDYGLPTRYTEPFSLRLLARFEF